MLWESIVLLVSTLSDEVSLEKTVNDISLLLQSGVVKIRSRILTWVLAYH